jgi:LemA protein
MKLSKSTIIFLAIVAIILVWGVTSYNSLVSQDEKVNTEWANVQTQYQRRADLIPNLVNTVKGYAAHESQTFQDVVDARAKATQMTLNVEDLTEDNLRKYQAAQSELSKGLGKLMAIAESYPDLKASQNFSKLQAQLEGTENRIAESRRLYNNAVKEYNVSVRRIPKSIIAGMFGFEKKAPFEATDAAQNVPTVEF